jgi:hypothetical protein
MDKILGTYYGALVGEQLSSVCIGSNPYTDSALMPPGALAQTLLSTMQQMIDAQFNPLVLTDSIFTGPLAAWIAGGRCPPHNTSLVSALAAAGVASPKMTEQWVVALSGPDPRTAAANMLITMIISYLIFHNADVDVILHMSASMARGLLEVMPDEDIHTDEHTNATRPRLRITPIHLLTEYDAELSDWVKTGYTEDIAAVSELAKKSWLGGQVAAATYALRVIKAARAHNTSPSVVKIGKLMCELLPGIYKCDIAIMSACAVLGAHIGYTVMADQCADIPAVMSMLTDDDIAVIMEDYTAALESAMNYDLLMPTDNEPGATVSVTDSHSDHTSPVTITDPRATLTTPPARE